MAKKKYKQMSLQDRARHLALAIEDFKKIGDFSNRVTSRYEKQLEVVLEELKTEKKKRVKMMKESKRIEKMEDKAETERLKYIEEHEENE